MTLISPLKDYDKINKILKMPSMAPAPGGGGVQQKPPGVDGGVMVPSVVGIPPASHSTPIVDPSSGVPTTSLGFPTGFPTSSAAVGVASSSSLPPSMMAQQQGSGFANPLLMHQQPPPLPPPPSHSAAQRSGAVDASEGFGGALINVEQQVGHSWP